MADRELRDRILNALNRSSHKWRTARSIARDVDVRIDDITTLLNSSDAFVRAGKPNARGESLYTAAEKHKRRDSIS